MLPNDCRNAAVVQDLHGRRVATPWGRRERRRRLAQRFISEVRDHLLVQEGPCHGSGFDFPWIPYALGFVMLLGEVSDAQTKRLPPPLQHLRDHLSGIAVSASLEPK